MADGTDAEGYAEGVRCSFLLAHYRYCIRLAKKRGYLFLTFSDYLKKRRALPAAGKPVLLMRHDMDFSLALAENFSAIEEAEGVRATYFVRVHAAQYNPFSAQNHAILAKLLASGHELGLHYESGFSRLSGDSAVGALKRDKQVLEAVLGRKVAGLASHEPSRSGIGVTPSLLKSGGFAYHAYEDSFVKDLKYISDSSSRWREGCMCSFIDRKIPRLCILTHPIWWYRVSTSENY